MDDKEIIEAAKHCTTGDCETCKLCDCDCECSLLFAKFIAENFEEKEPTPAEAETSSENNILQVNDTANLKICQEKIADIKENLLLIYEDLTYEEQKAWELGEIFNQIINILKAGEENG